jgi:hypothetical protein
MKTKQAMIKDRATMHKRISKLCNYLNSNDTTNYNDITTEMHIGKWHFVKMTECGIVYKDGNKWRGVERLTQQRLDKFVELCRAYQREMNKPKLVKQCEIKFPKSTHQVTTQVTHPVAKKTRRLRKVSLIKRIKFLFTGKF